ncbi:MAG: glycoside hydrolase family 2 [Bacteroidetes bacterium]|nr:glycoside hydrolase family 2 [Bacteroidota bacterium]
MRRSIVLSLALMVFVGSVMAQRSISLAGIWKFNGDSIMLPGSTDQGGKGYRTSGMSPLRLTRLFEYKGPAWYEKEVFVPSGWKGKAIRLFLERAHWESSVWVNDRPAGTRQSLSVAHVYDISGLVRPGEKNTIRIRVNNELIYNLEYSHAVSAETQTNWNGIIGRIELQASDVVHIGDVQVFPHLAEHSVSVELAIVNGSGAAVRGRVRLAARTPAGLALPEVTVGVASADPLIRLTATLPLGDKVFPWDEFDPALYQLAVDLATEQASDSLRMNFGLREAGVEGTRFTINGRPTFIRGTVNSAEFPLTGYPPMDSAAWRHIFTVCKDYGLNTMRFHSWCPPEEAFIAADRVGIYLQVENTDWRFTIGKDTAVNRYLTEESHRILQAYGNLPSFVFFCEGNELVGPTVNDFLNGLLADWKKDPRHLYTGGSGYPVVEGNQYNDYYGPRPQHWKEGLNGRFNARALNTVYDYSEYVKKFAIPLVSHEIGQWCVYPDFDQIPKYTGVLKPYNYEIFRESLRDHHMGDLARRFTEASGKFQVIQKKEEIESYLRTPGLGGYHLLQLNDFPGQGTAPVGVVDQFWDPKFYTSAREFSRFQSAMVPLLRTSGFIWTNDQVFTADMEFANFGRSALKQAVLSWTLENAGGTVFAKGRTRPTDIPLGSPFRLASLHIPLNRIKTATSLTLRLSLNGADCSNQWEIWVYPRRLPAVDTAGVRIAYEWNDELKRWLGDGGTVLLLADTAKIVSTASPVFSGISWNTVWSGMPPDLLGILCDPGHPALASFPTEFYSNWQWWDPVRHSKPMVMDSMPDELRPIVQMIPDWNKNQKIGLVWEAKVGKGRLLVSAIDLKDDLEHRPVAAQLLYSLKKYITGDEFRPTEALSTEMIDQLFKPTR